MSSVVVRAASPRLLQSRIHPSIPLFIPSHFRTKLLSPVSLTRNFSAVRMANPGNPLLESIHPEITPELQELHSKEPQKALNTLSKHLQSKSLIANPDGKLTLYGAKNLCPYCWKIDAYLYHYKIPFEYIQIDLQKKENRSPEYLKINPLGLVPALIDGKNGDLIAVESGALLLYVDDVHGQGAAKPSDPAELAKMYEIFYRCVGNLKSFEAGVIMYGREFDPAMAQNLFNEFRYLDEQLKERPFLATKDAPSLADWVALPEVTVSKTAGLNLEEKGLKNLAAWHTRMLSLPGVAEGDVSGGWDQRVKDTHGSWDNAPKVWDRV